MENGFKKSTTESDDEERIKSKFQKLKIFLKQKLNSNFKTAVEIAEDAKTESSASGSNTKSINPSKVSDLGPNQKIKPIPKARSLFMFSYENRFRRLCHFISNHRWFSNSLLVCILVSSIMLAAEDPVRYNSPTNDVCFIIDNFCQNIRVNQFFYLSDSEQIRLFFHERFHNRNMLETNFVWFHHT